MQDGWQATGWLGILTAGTALFPHNTIRSLETMHD
eukprot:COSAG05_NODE_275_length_12406_cov_12.621841_13_plen_35_part_00